LFWKLALRAFGPNTIVYGDGPCAMCALRFVRIPHYAIHFSFVADGATGIAAALRAKGREDITLVSSAGDGASSDISFGKISAAAERNENFIQICVDNEAYMNTGIQKSGLTPYGAWTTTTPRGKENNKKNISMIMAAHKVPYVATVSVAYPQDLMRKLEKAKAKSIEVTRLGVDTWVAPLFEIEKGVLKVNRKAEAKPVQEYLKAQGRFRHLTGKQIAYIQSEVDKGREDLLANDGKEIIH